MVEAAGASVPAFWFASPRAGLPPAVPPEHGRRRAAAGEEKGPVASGSGGGASSGDDDEGCSSPAKRARVAADEEKPIPTELSMQSETRASNGKGLPFDFDLNLPPSDEDGCPGAC